MRRIHFIAAVFFLRLFSLYGREVVIRVEDGELGLPLEGAIVHSWDGGVFECDEEGVSRIEVPDTGRVVVRVSYPGYETGRLVIGALSGDEMRVLLRLGGVLESRELVVEAAAPEGGEARPGRSVGVSGESLERTARVGIVEDVMSSVKLLPGVGYGSSFDAMPSIRGGAPRDIMAVLDGFYIEYPPYHWMGAVSIFDPNMVSAVRLSHGVFSARYGHTISGLLEVSSKQPPPGETAVDVGVSTSAATLNIEAPLGKSGGLLLMGKVTYWDPVIWAAKQVSEDVRMVTRAPYIRSGAVSANYRFTRDLKWSLNGFFGTDGVGAKITEDYAEGAAVNSMDISLDYTNYIGFLSMGLVWNPASGTVVKTVGGVGFADEGAEFSQSDTGSVRYSQDFLNTWGSRLAGATSYEIRQDESMSERISLLNYQGRVDLDRELGGGFLAAVGSQVLYTVFGAKEILHMLGEDEAPSQLLGDDGLWHDYYMGYPFDYTLDVRNRSLRSSGYGLLEYAQEGGGFGAELGLRVDHLRLSGRDYTLSSRPTLSPRLNLDFELVRNAGALDSLGLTAGTGLFSSMDDNVVFIPDRGGIEDGEFRLNRSWTSLAGTKAEFLGAFSLSFEAYYKYIFDRAYQNIITGPGTPEEIDFRFNGEGRVWGFDVMLQKLSSRYWDGWLSYSFTHARYRDPQGIARDFAISDNAAVGGGWYYPAFHRFHNLNLVVNIKPVSSFTITTRVGFASGVPRKEVGAISSRLVELADGSLIEKYKRREVYSDTARGGFSLPLDLKFSFFSYDPKSKVKLEVYFAVENLLSLVYTPKGDRDFNEYSGKEEPDSENAYEIPFPLPSFGFKWSY
ncbi:MAG: TonB-dependent receptor plug domain-containing protein [Spirochaetales bacterium]|nr:TonB-dependent receptor plug domain-containing protein [Spirochaetales bacterium]